MSSGVALFLEVQPATTVTGKAFCRSTRPGSSSITKRCLNRASATDWRYIRRASVYPDAKKECKSIVPDSRTVKWLAICVVIGDSQKLAIEDSMSRGITRLFSVGPVHVSCGKVSLICRLAVRRFGRCACGRLAGHTAGAHGALIGRFTVWVWACIGCEVMITQASYGTYQAVPSIGASNQLSSSSSGFVP
jgi:hypothetical protein